MGALETIREILGSLATASGSRQVIEIRGEQVAVLTEKVSDLEVEKSLLVQKTLALEQQVAVQAADIAELTRENAELKAKLEPANSAARLPEGFDETTLAVARAFFEHSDGLSLENVSRVLRLSIGTALFHADMLAREGFIKQRTFAVRSMSGNSPAIHGLTPAGRAFVVKFGGS